MCSANLLMWRRKVTYDHTENDGDVIEYRMIR